MLSRMLEIFIKNKPLFINGIIITLKLAIVGTVVGLLIGFVIGIIRTIPEQKKKSNNIILKVLRAIISVYVTFFRGTPMMVQSLVFFFGIQSLYGIEIPKLVAGYIIISINTGAYLSEVVRGGINSIDKGQFEGAKAIGMNHYETMRYIVIPQVLKNILPSVGNEFIINVKDSSVLNVIGVSEVFFTTRSIAASNYQFFETYFVTCIIYLTLTIVTTGILRLLEKKLTVEKKESLMQNQLQV